MDYHRKGEEIGLKINWSTKFYKHSFADSIKGLSLNLDDVVQVFSGQTFNQQLLFLEGFFLFKVTVGIRPFVLSLKIPEYFRYGKKCT